MNKKPIFILSCVRSGSTLLRYIMDSHPNICSPGHLDLGPLIANVYKTIYFSLGKISDTATEKERDSYSVKETERIISDILRRYTDGKEKKRWCEKSTINVDHLESLIKTFPDAKYICLYRNCLDVVNSCIKLNALGYMPELSDYIKKHPTNFVAAMIDNWMEKTKKLIEFEKEFKNQCVGVRYESLVKNPKFITKEIFEFLGEKGDDSIVDSVFDSYHDLGYGDPKVRFSDKIHKNSIGHGTSIPLSSIPNNFIPEINSLHNQLGYRSVEEMYSDSSDESVQTNSDLDLNNLFKDDLFKLFHKETDKFKQLRGVCKFIVTGRKSKVWYIESNSSGFSLKENNDTCDCTITTNYTVLSEVLEGNKNVISAYESGEIWGDGNMALALEFGIALFSYFELYSGKAVFEVA